MNPELNTCEVCWKACPSDNTRKCNNLPCCKFVMCENCYHNPMYTGRCLHCHKPLKGNHTRNFDPPRFNNVLYTNRRIERIYTNVAFLYRRDNA